MKSIAKWNEKELEVSEKFDSDKELEITILDKKYDVSVWLTKRQVKLLLEHLINVL